MKDITELKINAIKDILSSYYIYKGGYQSKLEKIIFSLQGIIDDNTYKALSRAFDRYTSHIASILGSSNRVYVKLDNVENINFDDFSDLFNI